jgi:tetratricopeptide (TPR) repeat protein
MDETDRIERRLKLYDLRVLLSVVEQGSMGKAAELLATSQPAVSRAIADLEHSLGVRLLDREQAIADYDAALAHNPRDPGSLYGRGLARLRLQNDPEGSRADLAAAKALDPGVAAEFARYGLGE